MALRDQPYLPLYIQDFLTDEKLNECSAATTGVYVKLMCLMHKSDDYGKLLLKEKYKTSESKEKNFASMLVRSLPFTFDEILASVIELISEKVLFVEGDFLCQKRMIKDNNLSLVRGNAGHRGGKGTVGKKRVGAGFIYLMSNQKEHKIGLSISPERRLFQLRSLHKIPDLEIIDTFEVEDMIDAENLVKNQFKDCIKDEWLKCEFEYAVKEFGIIKRRLHKAKSKAKAKATPENEIETEGVIENKVESTEDPAMVLLFERWVKYKVERKEGYKSKDSLHIAYEKLKRQSGNDHGVAKLMIEDAIGNGWKGFFEPKPTGHPPGEAQPSKASAAVNSHLTFMQKRHG